jgi:ATP-binding cassette subfamily B protein
VIATLRAGLADARRAVGSLRVAMVLGWRSHPAALAGSATLSVIEGALPVAVAWLAKVALDAVTVGGRGSTLWLSGVALVAGGCCVTVLPSVQRYLYAVFGRAVSLRSKDMLYQSITGIPSLGALETPEFRDRLRLAEQASRSAPGEVVMAGLGITRATITVVGMVAAVAFIERWAAIALIVSAIPALVAEIHLSRARAEMMWQISPAERREAFFATLLTDLSAAMEIRLFGIGSLLRRRMLTELMASNGIQRRFDRRELRMQVALAMASAAVAGFAILWVLSAARAGRATAGDVTAVIIAVGGLQAALAGAVQYVATAHYEGLLLRHFQALTTPVVEEKASAVSGAGSVRAGGEAGTEHAYVKGIELVDVWFRYDDSHPWVLRGISATLRPGEAVALVGENGSGKSTLVKLLCRFYDPSRGSIRWDGIDLRDIPPENLRRRICAVFQDFMSYDLTAVENIALGGVDGRDELTVAWDRVAAAAHAVEINEMLAGLPNGYSTLLSRIFVTESDQTNGVLLSGGQWQRLAVARALYRGRRDLLILDEPSAGLDAAAEYRVHQHIRHNLAGHTSLLLSHRLNTVRDADRILVLADGRIVESGDHRELMAAGGRYARLYRLQAAGYDTVATT